MTTVRQGESPAGGPSLLRSDHLVSDRISFGAVPLPVLQRQGDDVMDSRPLDDRLSEALIGLGPHPGKPEAMKMCPAHPNSKTPCLSTNLHKSETKTLCKCQNGCTQEAVIDALLGPKQERSAYTNGLAYQAATRPSSVTSRTEYRCTDPDEKMWNHVRLDFADQPKKVWWEPSGPGAQCRFYIPAGLELAGVEHLWLTEGEPAADALWAAGEPAIGLSGGVSAPPDAETVAHILSRTPGLKEVNIWPDAHDEHGPGWTATVAGHVQSQIRNVLVVSPPAEWGKGWDAGNILWPTRPSPMLHGFVPIEQERYEALERLGKHVHDADLLQPWDGIVLDENPVHVILNGLIDVRDAALSPDADEFIVEGFIRPRTVVGLAAFEGTGKSWMRSELGLRVAMGEGAWLGCFPTPTARRVLVIDMENGPDEEMRREDIILAGMGKARRDIPKGMYMRVSFPLISLDSEEGRNALQGVVADVQPELLVLDSGTMLVDDEVGARLKPVIRFLKRMTYELDVAILVVLHLVKPIRDPTRRTAAQRRRLYDVAGNWTKSLDVVAVCSEQDKEDTLRIDVRKRVDPSSYIIKQRDGLWVAVIAIRENQSVTLPKVKAAILADVHERGAVNRSGLVSLHDGETGFSKANVCKSIGALIKEGYVAEGPALDGEMTLLLTEAGEQRLSKNSATVEDWVPLDIA